MYGCFKLYFTYGNPKFVFPNLCGGTWVAHVLVWLLVDAGKRGQNAQLGLPMSCLDNQNIAIFRHLSRPTIPNTESVYDILLLTVKSIPKSENIATQR